MRLMQDTWSRQDVLALDKKGFQPSVARLGSLCPFRTVGSPVFLPHVEPGKYQATAVGFSEKYTGRCIFDVFLGPAKRIGSEYAV